MHKKKSIYDPLYFGDGQTDKPGLDAIVRPVKKQVYGLNLKKNQDFLKRDDDFIRETENFNGSMEYKIMRK